VVVREENLGRLTRILRSKEPSSGRDLYMSMSCPHGETEPTKKLLAKKKSIARLGPGGIRPTTWVALRKRG
jgi:hypothetical protein